MTSFIIWIRLLYDVLEASFVCFLQNIAVE